MSDENDVRGRSDAHPCQRCEKRPHTHREGCEDVCDECSRLDAKPTVARAEDINRFERFNEDDYSTLICRCGERFRWSGTSEGLPLWVAAHLPHLEPVSRFEAKPDVAALARAFLENCEDPCDCRECAECALRAAAYGDRRNEAKQDSGPRDVPVRVNSGPREPGHEAAKPGAMPEHWKLRDERIEQMAAGLPQYATVSVGEAQAMALEIRAERGRSKASPEVGYTDHAGARASSEAGRLSAPAGRTVAEGGPQPGDPGPSPGAGATSKALTDDELREFASLIDEAGGDLRIVRKPLSSAAYREQSIRLRKVALDYLNSEDREDEDEQGGDTRIRGLVHLLRTVEDAERGRPDAQPEDRPMPSSARLAFGETAYAIDEALRILDGHGEDCEVDGHTHDDDVREGECSCGAKATRDRLRRAQKLALRAKNDLARRERASR